MEEDMKNFIISCVNLGKELIDKENLSKKEEKFIENLDVIIEKYFN
jgi:catabolite regulation protein CreA